MKQMSGESFCEYLWLSVQARCELIAFHAKADTRGFYEKAGRDAGGVDPSRAFFLYICFFHDETRSARRLRKRYMFFQFESKQDR